MDFKKTKIAVASLMLASLTACATNKSNVDNTATGPRNVSTGDLRTPDYRNVSNRDMNRLNNVSYSDTNRFNNRNVSTGDVGTRDNLSLYDNTRYNQNVDNLGANRNNTSGHLGSLNNSSLNAKKVSNDFDFSTSEIQPMNYGFITIDPNSYSTATPSHQFPHSQRVQQGNYWYYTFGPASGQTGTKMPQQSTTPQTGQQATPVNPTAPRSAAPIVPKATQPAAPSTQSTAGISQMALQVIELTNNERRKNGLPSLKADTSLSKVAQVKTNDMQVKHYFSHTSPTYGSPFDMMRDFGVTYKSAGENIAMGQTTAQQVVTAWMNSEGHRKNILSPNYTNIGVGFTQNGAYWSQMFIGK